MNGLSIKENVENVCKEVLERNQIGLHEDIFELGCDSLLVTKIISRLNNIYNTFIPVGSIFINPTIAELSTYISEIVNLNSKHQGNVPTLARRQRGNNKGRLSYSQKRMWFLNQYTNYSPVYNVPFAIKLVGKLDTKSLEECISLIVEKHSALRTVIETENGEPYQVIKDNQFKLHYHKIPERKHTISSEYLRDWLSEESRKLFDLEKGPLYRIHLLSVNENEHVLCILLHHIISDGISIQIILDEISSLYSNSVKTIVEPSVDFIDFSMWQRQWLEGGELDKQLKYWRDKLDVNLPIMQLPLDKPRPSVQTYNGATYLFQINSETTKSLRDLSNQNGVTLFMTLLAVFITLLYRYTNQKDLLVGSPIAGRNKKETERLIGFFVNTLVLRAEVDGNETFSELLLKVRDTCLEAYSNSDVPFEKLVEELQPDRDLSISPLFQVIFQVFSQATFNLPEVSTEIINIETGTAKFDVAVAIRELENSLLGKVDYNVDLFIESTIKSMFNHYIVLLEEIIKDPNRKLAKIPLISQDEYQKLVNEWSSTNFNPTNLTKPIHKVFMEQVNSNPSAIALRSSEIKVLTYEELEEKATNLAAYLQKNGFCKGERIGLFVERSCEAIIGMIAILKLGCAYVPINTLDPVDRISFIINDSEIKHVLTTEELFNRLPSEGIQTYTVDLETIDKVRNEFLEVHVDPNDTAYIMYTSGSTGTPKGVEITHKGVVRLLKENDYINFDSKEVFLQYAPLAFDASTFEIWGSLLNEAELVLYPGENATLHELGEFIKGNGITTLWLTAGLFHQMVEHQLEDLRGVRQLIAGGDVLSVDHVKKVLNYLPDCRMVNGYGPTENTTFTCCFPMDSSTELSSKVPIGKPISNTLVYVFDENLQPSPIGVPGELYVGGEGLTKGYLKRADLNNQRFVDNPFKEGSKLYKTGDLVKYLRDGNIEFLGRIDEQVKIRGFRVELSEVDEVLLQHPDVSESITVAPEEKGSKFIITYVVLKNLIAFQEDLISFLKQKLPEYMIPLTIVILDKFPLTANGKVDKKLLPVMSKEKIFSDKLLKDSPPANAVEMVIAGIFEDVLSVQNVGRNQNFFDLGGHSLAVTKIISLIRHVFKVDISLSQFFANPTVSSVANLLLSFPKDSLRVEKTAELLLDMAAEEVAIMVEE